jgi:hypothetical protein
MIDDIDKPGPWTWSTYESVNFADSENFNKVLEWNNIEEEAFLKNLLDEFDNEGG